MLPPFTGREVGLFSEKHRHVLHKVHSEVADLIDSEREDSRAECQEPLVDYLLVGQSSPNLMISKDPTGHGM